MDGPKDCRTEQSKSDKKISYDIAYMWNLKKTEQMNSFKKQRVTDVENKLTVTMGERKEEEKLGVWDWYTYKTI